MENVDILEGNLFDCDGDTTVRKSETVQDVPVNDNYSKTYTCGSDDINTAMYVWLAVIGVIIVLVASIIYCARTKQQVFFLQSIVAEVNAWFVTKIPNRSESHQGLIEFVKNMKVIRTASVIMTCFALFVLIPVYGALSKPFGTHSYVYAWAISISYLTGLTDYSRGNELLHDFSMQ
jgi:hypothetical protein